MVAVDNTGVAGWIGFAATSGYLTASGNRRGDWPGPPMQLER